MIVRSVTKDDLVVDGDKYEMVNGFCYQGNMLSTERGLRMKKFEELESFLMSIVPSLRMKSQIFIAWHALEAA